MNIKRIPFILTVLFLSAMIFLSFSARYIHNRMIPNVTVSRLTKEPFTFERTLPDGTTRMVTSDRTAVPKDMYDSGFLYIVVPGMKNGDERTFARKINLQIGSQNENFYEIAEDFYDASQLFIIESNKEIQDGTEVYVKED